MSGFDPDAIEQRMRKRRADLPLLPSAIDPVAITWARVWQAEAADLAVALEACWKMEAEIDRLANSADYWRSQYGSDMRELGDRAERAEAEAWRLAEALREIAKSDHGLMGLKAADALASVKFAWNREEGKS